MVIFLESHSEHSINKHQDQNGLEYFDKNPTENLYLYYISMTSNFKIYSTQNLWLGTFMKTGLDSIFGKLAPS